MDAHLRDLRYFVAVAEELNFTRAAERLYVSQPALSKQIQGLEATLRARLFDRDRRQVRLTAAGEALLKAAREVLARWDGGTLEVAEAASEEARSLRVGTLTSIGRALYPAALDRFGQLQPGWRVELRSFGWGDPTAGLSERATDAALLWLPVTSPGIAHRVLFSERRFVAVGAKHRLGRCDVVSFAELADEAFVALPISAGPQRDFWLGAEGRKGGSPLIAAEVTSADETFELVASGKAVALLADGNAVIYARPGIVCIPVDGLSPAQLAIAWRDDDRRGSVAAFVQACVDVVASKDSASVPSTCVVRH
jgi:DNA-binding transcriptional LysR family regulator